MRLRSVQWAGGAVVSFVIGCSLNPQPLPPDAPEDAGSTFGVGTYDASNAQTTGSGGAASDSGMATTTSPAPGSDGGTHGGADAGLTLNGSDDAGADGAGATGGGGSDGGLDGSREDASDARVGDAPLTDAPVSDASGDGARSDAAL